ncbi:hypothetical protein [uncultured Muribaculum sp.]|uniref:hypothetical protein n=1 Tax=uncultured Muribaculum sp. TaxID=1918613 RepID=UPI0025EA5333|nr:hypothetical protein [uncultured Muribaculum sp.]
MKKLSLTLLVATASALSFTSCFGDSDDDNKIFTIDPPFVVVPGDAVILSANETANCYIVKPGSLVAFSTALKGNSTTETTGDVAACRLLWSDTPKLIETVYYVPGEKMAVVDAGDGIEGNAVIAATDPKGTILWSWHLWITDYDPDASAYTTQPNASGTTWTFMDRNLGALSAKPSDKFRTHGMLYQWGRKDPFPAPSDSTKMEEDSYEYLPGRDGETVLYDIEGNTLPAIRTLTKYHGTIAKSVTNPMTFYAMTYRNTGETDEQGNEIVVNDPLTGDWTDQSDDDLWGGESGKKTIYDPCPPGWKVPVSDTDGNTPYDWMKFASMTWSDENLGAIQDGQWFPACGTRVYASGGCDLGHDNPYGAMWFGTKGKASSDLATYPTLYGQYMFIINGKRTFKVNKDKRSQAMSLRAVRDTKQ